MEKTKDQLQRIFSELSDRIDTLNSERRTEGLQMIARSEVSLLGQMSLLANEKISMVLPLAQTGDLDAFLTMEYVVKEELKVILKAHGLLYDEDSPLIWVPKNAEFGELFSFENLMVKVIDAESALVSKAVKAPAKNKQLIRQAIASGVFSGLVDRILEGGGKLEDFVDG